MSHISGNAFPVRVILNQKPVIKILKRSKQNFLKSSFHGTWRIFVQIKNYTHTSLPPHTIPFPQHRINFL